MQLLSDTYSRENYLVGLIGCRNRSRSQAGSRLRGKEVKHQLFDEDKKQEQVIIVARYPTGTEHRLKQAEKQTGQCRFVVNQAASARIL